MSTLTDAIFFFRDGQVVQEMMKSEFDALLDGIFDAPDFAGRRIGAAYAQITDQLKIKSLVFFIIAFDKQGRVAADWNVPINQLMQSAGRGPDLGAGKIRLVCKSQCQVPWLADQLWEPKPAVFQALVQSVRDNRLGIVESDESWDSGWDDVPVLMAEPEPPVLSATAEIPTLMPDSIPTLEPVKPAPAAASAPAGKAAPAADSSEEYRMLKKEFEAMQAAYSVRIDKLQKERDALKEKNKTIADSLKQQAREQVEALTVDFRHDVDKKETQIRALKAQLENEQRRYAELKEQQVEQASQYQIDREEMMDRLQQGQLVSADKMEALQAAFAKELEAKVDAETAKVNEKLAMREVELFYREEQMTLLREEIAEARAAKQALLQEQGSDVLQALEDNSVTLVVFQPGVGHITLAYDDVGQFLDDRVEYLAGRCGVSVEHFRAWQSHYSRPVCQHVDGSGQACEQRVKKVDMVAQFVPGESDRCLNHKPARQAG